METRVFLGASRGETAWYLYLCPGTSIAKQMVMLWTKKLDFNAANGSQMGNNAKHVQEHGESFIFHGILCSCRQLY